jgi:hypothetical protein
MIINHGAQGTLIINHRSSSNIPNSKRLIIFPQLVVSPQAPVVFGSHPRGLHYA